MFYAMIKKKWAAFQKRGRDMNRVLDVARYIINYSNEKGYGISNLKLQKLLYLVQAFFLINSHGQQTCFNAIIEAWDFGPVVPDVYHEFKRYGGGDIPAIRTYLEGSDNSFYWATFDENIIPAEDRQLISDVVDNFKDYSATALVRLTHNQDPWIQAYHSGENNEITVPSIRDYFC